MKARLMIYLSCALVLAGLVAAFPAAAAAGGDAPWTNARPTAGIDLESSVSVDGGVTWFDADDATGPMLVQGGSAPQFRFVVANTGAANLANVVLTDSVLGNQTFPTTIAAGTSAEVVVNTTWSAGQHAGVARVNGTGAGQPVTDSDAEHYFGAAPAIDVEEYVSVDGGTTWLDADDAPGPACPEGTAPQFRFVVANTGNVALPTIALSETVLGSIDSFALSAGSSVELTRTGTWAAGQQAGVATAESSFTDDAGTTVSPADSDAVNYVGIIPVSADFVANITTGTAPLAVQFSDASTGDGIDAWLWEFGDGATSTEQNPVHVYADPGDYSVTLTATGVAGPDSETKAGNIAVIAPPPPVLAVPPGEALPTDTGADGLYDDVNGNGRTDFADVVLFFNQMTWIAANEPAGTFDYNGNGRIDFADVLWLFSHI